MSTRERMFRHENAHVLEDPERQKWLPAAEVIERLALTPGMQVADVGAGTGYFAIPIARAVSPGGRVLAVDVQPEMLERLRARIEPTTPIVPVEGDAARTTLSDASVDLAFLANVWHEFDDTEAVLTEMARVVRPGGRIAILDWRPDVEQPPGPPLAHRVAASSVEGALLARGWRTEPPVHVGTFSYMVVAARS